MRRGSPGARPQDKEDVASRLVQLLGDLAARTARCRRPGPCPRAARTGSGTSSTSSCEQVGAGASRRAGRCGRRYVPVATTTALARRSPSDVSQHGTRPAVRRGSTDVTATPSRTGAANPVAYRSRCGDDLVPQHEAVRIVAVVVAAGKLHRPVRRHQAEAVPAVAPRLPMRSALQYDVLDARLRQLVAGGQAGLPPADDDDPLALAHRGIVAERRGPARSAGRPRGALWSVSSSRRTCRRRCRRTRSPRSWWGRRRSSRTRCRRFPGRSPVRGRCRASTYRAATPCT